MIPAIGIVSGLGLRKLPQRFEVRTKLTDVTI
jgi:hypothetical protein